MAPFAYQFSVLNQLLTGDLSPGREPPNVYVRYITYVGEHYPDRQQHYQIRFNKQGENYHLMDYQPYRFAPIYPVSVSGSPVLDPALRQQLLNQVQTTLDILLDQVVSADLKKLEDETIVVTITIVFSLESLSLNEARFYYFQHILIAEVERIREAWHEEVLRLSTEEAIRMHIHTYQQSLRQLIRFVRDKRGKLSLSEICSPAWRFSLGEIDRFCLGQLSALYRFLETDFPVYVDLDALLPDDSWFTLTPSEKNQIDFIQAQLPQRLTDERLLRLALLPLQPLLNPTQEQLTHRRLHYCKQYAERLYTLLQSATTINQRSVAEFLAAANFNHLFFFNYCTDAIGQAIHEQETDEEQLDLLERYVKYYRQISNPTVAGYNFHNPPLSVLVINWLEAEVHYRQQALQRKKDILLEINSVTPSKIETNLSVAELAFLSRVFYEMGIFTNEQQKDMLRVIARNFSSVKQANISLQSLHTKYYNTEDTTRQAIKAMAERMMRYAERIR